LPRPEAGTCSLRSQSRRQVTLNLTPCLAPIGAGARLTSRDFPDARTGGLWDRRSHDIASTLAWANARACSNRNQAGDRSKGCR
jgi:hypothetical protein